MNTILSQLPKDICCILQLKIIFACISRHCHYLPVFATTALFAMPGNTGKFHREIPGVEFSAQPRFKLMGKKIYAILH